MLHALLFLTKSNKKRSENISLLKQYRFVPTDLGYEFVEEILKSGNLEFKTMMRRKTRRKGKTGEGRVGEREGKWSRKGGRVRGMGKRGGGEREEERVGLG